MNQERIRYVSRNAAKEAVNVDLLGLSPLGELKGVLGSLIVSAVFDKEHSQALSQKMASWMRTVQSRVKDPQRLLDGAEEHAWNQLAKITGATYRMAKEGAEGQQIAAIVHELRKQYLGSGASGGLRFQLPSHSIYSSGRPVFREHDAISAAFVRSSSLPPDPKPEVSRAPSQTSSRPYRPHGITRR